MEFTLPDFSLSSPPSMQGPLYLSLEKYNEQLRFGATLLGLFSSLTADEGGGADDSSSSSSSSQQNQNPLSLSILHASLSTLRRFYAKHSLHTTSILELVPSISFLVHKSHEAPVPLNIVVLTYQRILCGLTGKPFKPFLQSSPHYARWSGCIKATEQKILSTLGFALYSLTKASPLPHICSYLHLLSSSDLLPAAAALSLLAARTDATVRYPPHVAALSIVSLLLPSFGRDPPPSDFVALHSPSGRGGGGEDRKGRGGPEAVKECAAMIAGEAKEEGGFVEAVKEGEEVWGWEEEV